MDKKYLRWCLDEAVKAGERGDQPVAAAVVMGKQSVLGANRITSAKNRLLHAEMDALQRAIDQGIDTQGATLYSTVEPCHMCLGAVLNTGISRLVVSVLLRDIHPDETINRRYGTYSAERMLGTWGVRAGELEYLTGVLKDEALATWRDFENSAWKSVIL